MHGRRLAGCRVPERPKPHPHPYYRRILPRRFIGQHLFSPARLISLGDAAHVSVIIQDGAQGALVQVVPQMLPPIAFQLANQQGGTTDWAICGLPVPI